MISKILKKKPCAICTATTPTFRSRDRSVNIKRYFYKLGVYTHVFLTQKSIATISFSLKWTLRKICTIFIIFLPKIEYYFS